MKLYNLENANATCAKHKTAKDLSRNEYMNVNSMPLYFLRVGGTYHHSSALPHESWELPLHVKIHYLTSEYVNTTLGTLKNKIKHTSYSGDFLLSIRLKQNATLVPPSEHSIR